MRITLITATLFAAGIAGGQSNQISIGVPWLGWVFDSGVQSVRPITGLAMSATLGAKADGVLSKAVGSPEGSFALGVAAEDGKVLIVRGDGSGELSGARANPSRIAMSIKGKTAALYYDDGGAVQVFAGLPEAPRLALELTIDGVLSAFAVDDAASAVLASTEAGLFAYRSGLGKQLVLAGGDVVEAGFFGAAGDVVATSDGKVTLIRGEQVSELSKDDGIVEPLKAAVSADGRTLVVLLKQGSILVRDLAAGSNRTLSCDCTPTGLSRLHGNSLFRLNGLEDGTVWLFSGDEDEPKVTFVATRGEN